MKKEIIYIQVWQSKTAKVWDDIPATLHTISNPSEFAQEISNIIQCPVRLTYYSEGIPVGSLNGSYFNPKTL